MVKVKSRSEIQKDAAASGGTLKRVRPVHLFLLLGMSMIYYETNRVSRAVQVSDGPQGSDLTSQVSNGLSRLTGVLATSSTTEAAPATGLSTTTKSATETTTAATSADVATPEALPKPAFNMGCTPLQKRLIQKALPNGKTIIDATKCPDSSAWLNTYLEERASETDAFIFLNFGCNKGYDSLFMAETISRNVDVFNKQKWAQAIAIGHPGNCNQGSSKGNTVIDPTLAKRPVEVHCIEAMPQTAEKLIHASEVTGAKANGLHAYNYAMTGTAGGAPILFPNPKNEVGRESLGIGHCNDPKMKEQCVEVATKTVDEFVKDHVDSATPNRRIPFMSVDVEGFDFTVLKGAGGTLKRTDYLEFEYHGMGDWASQKLEDAMNMLKDNGFVCYWSGVNQLWRLSDTCWMDHFEFHQWSNVACVDAEHQPKLAARMEQVFEDTLVQGTATTK